MRCHAGRIPIVNRVKIRGHVPPKGGVGTKDEYKGRGGGGRVDPPPFCLASKKNVIHQADFLAGILRCSARDLFEYLMCFFQFFCIFVILLCFGLKKDSSYKHPDFYANLIHPSPLP